MVINYLESKFNNSINILNLFDDEGKATFEHKIYMCCPDVMDYLCCVDPTIRDNYSDIENKLFDFYHTMWYSKIVQNIDVI